jgi:hypothetical protein
MCSMSQQPDPVDPGRDDDGFAGVSDAELIGVLCAWDRVETHAAARKLAAVAELGRRNPGPQDEEFAADQLACALAESRGRASDLLDLAAAQCDHEHNTPYETGGRTCLCNTGPKCRHDHRLKQHPRWTVDQLPDGTFRWTTPSGRSYDAEPTRYPV